MEGLTQILEVPALVLFAMFIAVGVEGAVEFTLGEIFDLLERLLPATAQDKYLKFKPTLLRSAAVGVGIYATVGVFRLDLIYYASQVLDLGFSASVLGEVVTGIFIGRGATAVHEWWSLKRAQMNRGF